MTLLHSQAQRYNDKAMFLAIDSIDSYVKNEWSPEYANECKVFRTSPIIHPLFLGCYNVAFSKYL